MEEKLIDRIKGNFFSGLLVGLVASIVTWCGIKNSLSESKYKNYWEQYRDTTKIESNYPSNIHEVCWDVADGELITPHRNSYYGTKGPVYKIGDLDSLGKGKMAFEDAKEIIKYKNDFSKMAGSDKQFYWLCRVDDFNKDGIADQISWPRMGDKMPVYKVPFVKEMQEKADKVILLEDYLYDYLKDKY